MHENELLFRLEVNCIHNLILFFKLKLHLGPQLGKKKCGVGWGEKATLIAKKILLAPMEIYFPFATDLPVRQLWEVTGENA